MYKMAGGHFPMGVSDESDASVKKMCRKCKLIRRKRVVRVICTDPRHKQRRAEDEGIAR